MTFSMSAGNAASGQNGSPRQSIALTLSDGHVAALAKGISLWNLDGEGWANWKRHLSKRRKPAPLIKLAKRPARSPLLWGMTDDAGADTAVDVLLRCVGAVQEFPNVDWAAELDDWLAHSSTATVNVRFAQQALAWAHALPQLAGVVPAAQWCDAVSVLLALAGESSSAGGDGSPLPHQILAGELPLTLAYLLPEIEVCRQSAEAARSVLSEGALAVLDGEGLPQGAHLDQADVLLAVWTRSMLLGQHLKKGCFADDALAQYEWFVRQMMRLRRADGLPMLGSKDGGAWHPELFECALRLVGDREDRTIAEQTLPQWTTGETKKHRRLPPAAINSEWAELALLRASWHRAAPRLLLNYSRQSVASELTVDGSVVWSGDCTPEVYADGSRLAVVSGWEELCWDSDRDGDYVEIEASLAGGWKLQRQFYLARDDKFLLVADAILGTNPAELHYRCRWPLDSRILAQPAEETMEVALAASKRVANVLPLALPEWRCDGRRRGDLTESNGELQYDVKRPGRRLYAPLFIDLERPRLKKELTWRQLSIGQDLMPQPPEVAAGYRVQAAGQQWLIYRSLGPRASRTVLGQNIYNEFVCARFHKSGETDSLIEIE